MRFSMIDYTGKGLGEGYAAKLLGFAKNTRLMRSSDFNETEPPTTEEIKAIASTIPSAWEFLHYTFLLEDVTRAFTHQLVRTRTASYAQQTMRVLPMEDFGYKVPEKISGDPDTELTYERAMWRTNKDYQSLLDKGAAPEDARGILPTNICTNILVSMNLRTVVETVRKRSSPRVQGEYREFVERLQDEVIDVHPFTGHFFGLDWPELSRQLSQELEGMDKERATRIAKLFSKVTEGVTS